MCSYFGYRLKVFSHTRQWTQIPYNLVYYPIRVIKESHNCSRELKIKEESLIGKSGEKEKEKKRKVNQEKKENKDPPMPVPQETTIIHAREHCIHIVYRVIKCPLENTVPLFTD